MLLFYLSGCANVNSVGSQRQGWRAGAGGCFYGMSRTGRSGDGVVVTVKSFR
jgi:hypothetical protein